MLFEDVYKTVQIPSEGFYKDKGSRFSGFLFPVDSEAQIKSQLNIIKKMHSLAGHHCYAFRLQPGGTIFRFSDDREPSGTAGKPILNQLLSADITNVLLVVVRYFGGSLLGIPGLINAYKTSASSTIANDEIVQKYIMESWSVSFEFNLTNDIMQLFKEYNATIIRTKSDEKCNIDFEVRKSLADLLIHKIKNLYKCDKVPVVKYTGSVKF